MKFPLVWRKSVEAREEDLLDELHHWIHCAAKLANMVDEYQHKKRGTSLHSALEQSYAYLTKHSVKEGLKRFVENRKNK